jgi:RecB family exonuclease
MIEHEVRYDVAGVPMLGYVDLVDLLDDGEDSDAEIVDLKTSGKSKPQSAVDSSLQLTFYSLALGVSRVRYDVLVTTKTPKIERLTSIRRAEDYRWLYEVVGSVSMAISAGIFPPCSADSWCCSERWCGYWQHCRGARR